MCIGTRGLSSCAYALDDAGAHASKRSLDLFVARRAHDECAPGVNRREEGVAVVEAVFEVATSLERLLDDPVKLAFLCKVD